MWWILGAVAVWLFVTPPLALIVGRMFANGHGPDPRIHRAETGDVRAQG